MTGKRYRRLEDEDVGRMSLNKSSLKIADTHLTTAAGQQIIRSKLSFFARCFRVRAAFLAAAEREAGVRAAAPCFPPLRAGALFTALPRPEPDFLPPPVILFTVAQARCSAVFSLVPRTL